MKFHIAIPVMNESKFLPKTLDCIANQSNAGDFSVYICVNQPESWWENASKKEICEDNQQTLQQLKNEHRFPLTVFDCSSKEKGMPEKQSGVGFARKLLIENVLKIASSEDLIVSLDADTTFSENYFKTILQQFQKFPESVAMATPYYHQLSGDENMDRAMLRYEIYMRFYALNLTKIESPYNFTALGSAIVVPVWAMKAVRGISPKVSGEDFYLLQKLRKFGKIILSCPEKVYPATRYSDRVPFGTGPAIAKTMHELQKSYPLYPPELFDQIKVTYDCFPKLWKEDIPTPMDDFLHNQLGNQIWQPLRDNFKTETQFIRACHEKIDGLRTLQFLKNSLQDYDDSVNFAKNWNCFFNSEIKTVDFLNEKIEFLQEIRDQLTELEDSMRKTF